MTLPLDIKGAAQMLGVCRRSLDGFLALHRDKRLFEYRGNKRVFYEEHILMIRKLWDNASRNPVRPAVPPIRIRKASTASDRVMALLTKPKRRK